MKKYTTIEDRNGEDVLCIYEYQTIKEVNGNKHHTSKLITEFTISGILALNSGEILSGKLEELD